MAEDHWARDAPRLCRPTCSNSMSIGLSHLLGMSQVMHSTSLRLKTLLTTVSWGETTRPQTGAESDQAVIQLASCLKMHVPSLTEIRGPGVQP